MMTSLLLLLLLSPADEDTEPAFLLLWPAGRAAIPTITSIFLMPPRSALSW